jgi:hypothetical protein
MSERFPGGIISKTAPVPTGPYENGTAPGIWTLEQQAEFVRQGIWPIAGNVPNYIEDVFSTWLYTGTGATNQTITNGIDLAGKGGLVWVKNRAAANHALGEPNTLGFGAYLSTSTTTAVQADTTTFRAFNSNGFTVGSSSLTGASSQNYVSWTFREQPKFFDTVTYTGDGTANRNVAHALGAAPGFVIIKRTNNTSNWNTAARLNNGDASFMMLNRTVPQTSTSASWFNSTTFKVGTSDWPSSTGSPDFFGYDTNGTGDTYVAYLFAHNAGGFGLSGTDNVISCGSFTTDGSGNATVNLGYEPQWLLWKSSTNVDNWRIGDNMRGWTTSEFRPLFPNLSNAEGSSSNPLITSTGFQMVADNANRTFIYIAIRRGPMKTPTTGTSVLDLQLYTGNGSSQTVTGPTNAFQYDSLLQKGRSGTLTGYAGNGYWVSKLQLMSTASNGSAGLGPAIADAEINGGITNYTNTGFSIGGGSLNTSGTPYVNYWLRRAPVFMDQVCYTGTGANRTVAHNLAAVPELMIVKRRDTTGNWNVYSAALGATQYILLNSDYYALPATSLWNDTAPTPSVFTVGTFGGVNASGGTYVAYLFATCAGVSKVGSYTGTGTTQTINCGFTGGARFVMIKRTDFDGDWYVWDTARGMIPANDPYLRLNLTTAEVTGTDFVDTTNVGFEITSTAPAAINASGGTFIFLAIA